MTRVVLLPGLACDEDLWSDQCDALTAAGHEVVVGQVHTRADTLPAMARLLLSELSGPLTLVGSSMGGMLALEVFRQASERVAAMGLLGSTARADTPEIRALRQQAVALFAQGRMNEVLQANVPLAFHPRNAADARLVQRYFDMVHRSGAHQLIAQNQAVMARPDSRDLLGQIQCPVLVLWGDHDALTPPACSLEIVEAIAHARYAQLDQCGHLLTWEQPQQVNAHLLQWLEAEAITPPPKHTSAS